MPSVTPKRKVIRDMTLYEMVAELRDSTSPITGKEHHTLTEISRAAGASKGWAAYIIQHGSERTPNETSQRYFAPLRRYLRKLRQGKLGAAHPAQVEGVPAPSGQRMQVVEAEPADTGSNDSTPDIPVVTGDFMALYADFQALALEKLECFDALIDAPELRALRSHCPPLFVPMLTQLRSDLEVVRDQYLSLLQRIDGSASKGS